MNPLNLMDPSRCPLCGAANACQLCTPATYKGPCWCAQVEVPEELLAQVPEALRNRACICAGCVAKFHVRKMPQPVRVGDFYFDADGKMVFTEKYHLRRGHCCGSGCRHCPYTKPLAALQG